MCKPPFAPTWPNEMLTTVVFSKESEKTTRVKLSWALLPEVLQIELETFLSAKQGMTIGWTGSFDKLEHELNSCR